MVFHYKNNDDHSRENPSLPSSKYQSQRRRLRCCSRGGFSDEDSSMTTTMTGNDNHRRSSSWSVSRNKMYHNYLLFLSLLLFMTMMLLLQSSVEAVSFKDTSTDPTTTKTSKIGMIHPIGHDTPWTPGPHPHRTYNRTTKTWWSQYQQRKRSLHENEGEDDDDQQQTNIIQYQLWKPEEIAETVQKWSTHYSTLLTVTTSQEMYHLPTAGGDTDCPYDTTTTGCKNYILIIQDHIAHPNSSDETTYPTSTPPSPTSSLSSKRLPDVLWSGELHGDERVGPTAVLEATQLLLDAAICEALPRLALQPSKSGTRDQINEWDMELQRAHECRHDLSHRGIDDIHRKWLARLVTTRRIVIVPTANALGYYQNKREENHIDPNRDFPYDQTNPQSCMQTIAGRTLNEIFRKHLFQLSLTFHGGMEVIGYEWGAPSYSNKVSPDDIAQHDIAKAYSQYAGGFATTPAYDFGPYVLFCTIASFALQLLFTLRFLTKLVLFSCYLLLCTTKISCNFSLY